MSTEGKTKKNIETSERKAAATSEEKQSTIDPISRMPSSDSSTNLSLQQHIEDTAAGATGGTNVPEITVSEAAYASPSRYSSKQSTEPKRCRSLSPNRNIDPRQSPRKSGFSGALSDIKGYLSGSKLVKGAKEAYTDTVTIFKSGIRSVSSSPEKNLLVREESESELPYAKEEDDLTYFGFIDPDIVEKEDPETECMTDSTSIISLDTAVLETEISPEKSSKKSMN
ncbi:uncharacterized protein [Parasteatoda tepidariorum]|uniref:uncharacterized protein n=1 Tax=Parasteatoda tepidariorum TaxID=114398 RepID=UPI00077FA0CC|nr:uncharacterized protein LOC107452336 [Parasteatoda tepidariorum]XP_015924247.1 uncharacterized protein LOC107452336 [Parasteatoda tepidariorum]